MIRMRLFFGGCVVLSLMGCSLPALQPLAPAVVPTPVAAIAVSTPAALPSPTRAEPPAIASRLAEPVSATGPSTSAPVGQEVLCTVEQNLNVRPGPARAYGSPLTMLHQATTFTPIGRTPDDHPEGLWLQLQTSSGQGWVRVERDGQQYVSCAGDIATLPIVPVSVTPEAIPTPESTALQPTLPQPTSPPMVTSVDVQVNPDSSTSCPRKLTLSGVITMTEPGTVTYQWTLSNGTTSSEKRITFAAPGSKTVEIDLEFPESFSGWAQLHILEPNDMISSQVDVAVTCAAP